MSYSNLLVFKINKNKPNSTKYILLNNLKKKLNTKKKKLKCNTNFIKIIIQNKLFKKNYILISSFKDSSYFNCINVNNNYENN